MAKRRPLPKRAPFDVLRAANKQDRAARPWAQHPRPELAATPDGPATSFAACWARLVSQWLLPSSPLDSIELTIEDLHHAAREMFSAGGVHHVEQTRKFIDLLGDAPDKAWLVPTPGESRFVSAVDEPDTELE
jgi:hypothetical protein